MLFCTIREWLLGNGSHSPDSRIPLSGAAQAYANFYQKKTCEQGVHLINIKWNTNPGNKKKKYFQCDACEALVFPSKKNSQEEISVVQEIKVYILKACVLKAEENSTSQVTSLWLLEHEREVSASSQQTQPGRLHHTVARFSCIFSWKWWLKPLLKMICSALILAALLVPWQQSEEPERCL